VGRKEGLWGSTTKEGAAEIKHGVQEGMN
jgi:hypothetical protein